MRKLLLTQKVRYEDYQLLPIRFPTYQQYWSKNPMLDLPFFSNAVSYKQFQAILCFLNFGEHPEFTDNIMS